MYSIIISSCLYAGAFIYPQLFSWTIFIFLIPLYRKQVNFAQGYLWGCIFFSIHLSWLWFTLHAYGQGGSRCTMVYLITVAYFSLFSGFWFWLQQQLFEISLFIFSIKRKRVALFCTWVISTGTFFYITSYCSMAICDYFEGYPLVNPILILASYPLLLRPLFYTGVAVYWVFIVVCNDLLFDYVKNIKTLIIFLFLGNFSLHKINFSDNARLENDTFKVCNFVGHFIPVPYNDIQLSASEKFYSLIKVFDAINFESQVDYIVISESGFAHDVIQLKQYLDAWTYNLPEHCSIIIGAHRCENGRTYNTAYQIRDGNIVQWYDKQHLMFFVERDPAILGKCFLFQNLFSDHAASFSYPLPEQNDIFDAFQIFMCSELLYEIKKPKEHATILFLCNDAWLSCRYMKELVWRFVQVYALRYHVSIVYVGTQEIKIQLSDTI